MLLRILLVIALCAPLAAQSVGRVPLAPAKPPAQPTFRVSTKLIVTTVVVRNPDGTSVEGLTADDFVLTEDNVPQDIAVVEYQRLDNLEPLAPMETLTSLLRPASSSSTDTLQPATSGSSPARTRLAGRSALDVMPL